MATDTSLLKKDSELPAETVGETTAVAPPVDIYENADEFLLVADVPGVAKDGVAIHLENERLTLTARRSAELAYRRTFLLPEGVDFDKSSADLRDGVLWIHVPKAASARPRRIQVRG